MRRNMPGRVRSIQHIDHADIYLEISADQPSISTRKIIVSGNILEQMRENLHTAGQITRVAAVRLVALLTSPLQEASSTKVLARPNVLAMAAIIVRVFPSPISSAMIPPKSSSGFLGFLVPIIVCS